MTALAADTPVAQGSEHQRAQEVVSSNLAGCATDGWKVVDGLAHGIAAVHEVNAVLDKHWLVEVTKEPHPNASFAVNGEDLIRMIENIADQLSDVAAQNVELRRRLDKLEKPREAPAYMFPSVTWNVS